MQLSGSSTEDDFATTDAVEQRHVFLDCDGLPRVQEAGYSPSQACQTCLAIKKKGPAGFQRGL